MTIYDEGMQAEQLQAVQAQLLDLRRILRLHPNSEAVLDGLDQTTAALADLIETHRPALKAWHWAKVSFLALKGTARRPTAPALQNARKRYLRGY